MADLAENPQGVAGRAQSAVHRLQVRLHLRLRRVVVHQAFQGFALLSRALSDSGSDDFQARAHALQTTADLVSSPLRSLIHSAPPGVDQSLQAITL